MVYAVAAGIACGLLLGGSPRGLSALRFRWGPLALAAMAIQVALFSGPVVTTIGDLGAPIYVASSALVLVVVLRNRGLPGLRIVALGAASNLAAIVANGGWMPADPGALAATGQTIGAAYSNSRVVTSPALAALTDIAAMPTWMPLANVFSIGDVLIGLGIAVAIVVAMRQAGSAPNATRPSPGLAVR